VDVDGTEHSVAIEAHAFFRVDDDSGVIISPELNPGLSIGRLTSAARQIGGDILFGLGLR